MKKKILALVLTAVLVLGGTISAFAFECEHKNFVVDKSTVSCTESGLKLLKCTDCRTTWSTNEPSEHNMEEGVCRVCGYTDTEAPHEHDFVEVKREEANCTYPAYVWTECSCGEVKNGEVGEPNPEAHVFVDGVCELCGAEETVEETCAHETTYVDTFEATCMKEGYKNTICKDCGETVAEETLPVNDNHAFHNGVCLLCGEEEVEEECAHGNTHVDIFEASCSKEGTKKTICDDCGETVAEEVLPVNDNHAFYNGTCLLCGKEDKCDHEATYTDTLEANCSAEGYVKVFCKECDELLSETVLEKNDIHFFYNGTCMKCGKEEVCDHEMVVVKELAPTCIEAGYVWQECSKCGYELNYEVGEATGAHNYEVVKEQAPNCIEAGYVWKECTVCGAEKNHEVGEPNGEHNYEVVKEEAGTCTVPGYVWKECTVCGAEKNHETVVDANAHNYEIVKELAPTCKEPGYVWKECVDCGAEKNHEVGEANGEHSGETYVDIFEASCSKEGYKKTLCKECDEVLSEEVLPVNDNHAFHDGKCLLCGIDEEAAEEPEDPADPTTPVEPEDPADPTTPVEPEDPADPTTSVEPETPAEDIETEDAPKTGDQSTVLFVSMICLASLSGAAFIVARKRRAF